MYCINEVNYKHFNSGFELPSVRKSGINYSHTHIGNSFRFILEATKLFLFKQLYIESNRNSFFLIRLKLKTETFMEILERPYVYMCAYIMYFLIH